MHSTDTPPTGGRDRSLDHLDGPVSVAARRLDRIGALLEPLHGLPVSAFDHAMIEHLAGADTAEVVVALLWRARAAVPLPDPTGPTR